MDRTKHLQNADLQTAIRVLQDPELFSAYLERAFDNEEDLIQFLARMLIPASRHGFRSGERKNRLFQLAQQMGIHFLPAHFYSPVPNTGELPDALWTGRLPVEFDASAMANFVSTVSAYAGELGGVPKQAAPGVLHWDNPSFSIVDASLYYCILRHFRPARVIEIGGGYSTLVARMAAARNGFRLECVEPYPPDWLLPVPDELLPSPVQSIGLDRFASLGENDVLFIDSTHTVKIGGDVVHLFLRVLPLLRPGVIVHVHDIFLPREYPKKWVTDLQLFWNEQYMLAAFLSGNPDWQVLAANYYAVETFPELLKKAFPVLEIPRGCSLWMVRRPPAQAGSVPQKIAP